MLMSLLRGMTAVALWAFAAAPHAQNYPVKPVRLLTSFPAGGSTDTLARIVSQKLQDALGQSVIVEGRPGGATNIGAEVAAKAPADGYTLYLGIDATMTMNPWMHMTYIPFQGAPQQTQALISGEIALAIVGVMPYANYVRNGQMLGLATTGARRESLLPDMPTVRESGYPGLEGCNWLALFAPAGTPRPIIERLNAEVGKVLANPEVRQRLMSSGMESSHTSPEELDALVRKDLAKWGPIVKAAGFKRE